MTNDEAAMSNGAIAALGEYDNVMFQLSNTPPSGSQSVDLMNSFNGKPQATVFFMVPKPAAAHSTTQPTPPHPEGKLEWKAALG